MHRRIFNAAFRNTVFLIFCSFVGSQAFCVIRNKKTTAINFLTGFPGSWPYLINEVDRKQQRTNIFAIHGEDVVLADDEPLSARFRRAVVLQRAGEYNSALKEYEIFVKAAEQCEISPSTYSEVRVNMGAIYTKLKRREEARKNFKIALQYREIGSAHVNLALLVLAEGQQSSDPRVGIRALKEAEEHCRKAVELNDDVHSVNGATRLLGDIKKMLSQAGMQ